MSTVGGVVGWAVPTSRGGADLGGIWNEYHGCSELASNASPAELVKWDVRNELARIQPDPKHTA